MESQIKIIKVEKFNDVNVRIFNFNGQNYLSADDLGACLQFENPKVGVQVIFTRHREELEPHTRLVTIDTPGGPQETRLYSETGAYLVAMFARTKRAKEVRLWLAELPKKVREFGQVTKKEFQKAVKEAYNQGRLEALKELGSLIDEVNQLQSQVQKGAEEAVAEAQRVMHLVPAVMKTTTEFSMDIARASFELSRLNLSPEILDRLLLQRIIGRTPLETSKTLSLRIDLVEKVFDLLDTIGIPLEKIEFPYPLPWEEAGPQEPVHTDLERMERYLMNLATKVIDLAGGWADQAKAFALLRELKPAWLIIGNKRVHITGDVITTFQLGSKSIKDLAVALSWKIGALKGKGSGIRTISLSKDEFYARYFQQLPALPGMTRPRSIQRTPADALCEWLRFKWETSDEDHRREVLQAFIEAFPEAQKLLGNLDRNPMQNY